MKRKTTPAAGDICRRRGTGKTLDSGLGEVARHQLEDMDGALRQSGMVDGVLQLHQASGAGAGDQLRAAGGDAGVAAAIEKYILAAA